MNDNVRSFARWAAHTTFIVGVLLYATIYPTATIVDGAVAVAAIYAVLTLRSIDQRLETLGDAEEP